MLQTHQSTNIHAPFAYPEPPCRFTKEELPEPAAVSTVPTAAGNYMYRGPADWQQHDYMYRGPGTAETASLSGKKKEIAEEYRPLLHIGDGKVVVLRIGRSGAIAGPKASTGMEASTETGTAVRSNKETGSWPLSSHWKHVEHTASAKKGELEHFLKSFEGGAHVLQFDDHDEDGNISLKDGEAHIKGVLDEICKHGRAVQGVLLNACDKTMPLDILEGRAGFVIYPANPQCKISVEAVAFFSERLYRGIGIGKHLLGSFDEANRACCEAFGQSASYKLDIREVQFW